MNPLRDLERKVEYLRRLVADLARLVTAHNQQIPLAGMGGFGNGSGSAGAFYSDPGSTVVSSGASEDLTVTEARDSGDVSVGTRKVLNRFPDDTEADKRLFLIKCSDNSYLIVSQACTASGG